MSYPRENMIDVLRVAIYHRAEYEKQQFGQNFESDFVAGMRIVLEALERGEELRLT
jgi:hypothetical protein